MRQAKKRIPLRCPKCKEETNTYILPETMLLHFPLVCPQCKAEFIISVVKGRIMVEKKAKA